MDKIIFWRSNILGVGLFFILFGAPRVAAYTLQTNGVKIKFIVPATLQAGAQTVQLELVQPGGSVRSNTLGYMVAQ